MSSVKNVSGNYDIYANLVTIYSDLRIIGNSTTITSTNSFIQDNIIILNNGETGAGVTLGNAGIMVDRGISANAYWQFNETSHSWEGRLSNGNLINLSSGNAVALTDVVTLDYFLNHPPHAAAPNGSVQFNQATNLHGNANFTFDEASVALHVGNMTVAADYIQHTSDITVNSPLRMTNMGGQPTAFSNHTTVYANVPGGGGTGVYFVNTSNHDELISKKKATVLALIFS